jgi:hypothetical protein
MTKAQASNLGVGSYRTTDPGLPEPADVFRGCLCGALSVSSDSENLTASPLILTASSELSCFGLGNVSGNGDLWPNLSGEFFKFWSESLPDIDVPMPVAVLRSGQLTPRDFVAGFLSPPISDWRNGDIVLAADLCQPNVGHAKFLGQRPHGSRPDFFV